MFLLPSFLSYHFWELRIQISEKAGDKCRWLNHFLAAVELIQVIYLYHIFEERKAILIHFNVEFFKHCTNFCVLTGVHKVVHQCSVLSKYLHHRSGRVMSKVDHFHTFIFNAVFFNVSSFFANLLGNFLIGLTNRWLNDVLHETNIVKLEIYVNINLLVYLIKGNLFCDDGFVYL
jgi:hypothetical protein